MGYAASGLELWAYPLQIVQRVSTGLSLRQGTTTEIGAATLLRRITYEPEAVTRTYIGPGFIVRERLFVPLDEPAVYFYLRSGVPAQRRHRHPLHAGPRSYVAGLDGRAEHAIGTQRHPSYVLAEATHRYSAFIGSPDVIAHDEVLNSAQPGALGNRLAFAVRAGGEAKSISNRVCFW